MVNSTEQLSQFLLFQIQRRITNFAKNSLVLFEDLQHQYDIPPEQYQRIRKKTLDQANDAYRELEQLIQNLEITLNNPSNRR